MDNPIKNWHIIGWVILIMWFLFVRPYLETQQINKIDRKLTCIYNLMVAQGMFQTPESQKDRDMIQRQADLVISSCDTSYLTTGIPRR